MNLKQATQFFKSMFQNKTEKLEIGGTRKTHWKSQSVGEVESEGVCSFKVNNSCTIFSSVRYTWVV